MIYRKFQRERDKMNTPKYLEIAELLRIDIFVKHAKENQLIPGIRRYAQIYNVIQRLDYSDVEFENMITEEVIKR
ncbi:MAG: hypothetical protein V8S39_02510 [Lachnospiraceae bacterium]